jgi:uncharacterized protein
VEAPTLREAIFEDMKVNWEELARELKSLTKSGEIGGSSLGVEAIELILGRDFFEQAVEQYITFKPGFELARSVLLVIKPWTAMKYCYDIYKNTDDIEIKRSAIGLLKVISDRRVLEWLPEFLADPDEGVQNGGMGIIDQLLFWEIHHQRCVDILPQLSAPLVTTWACFTEAMYLLGRYGGWLAQEELWSYVTDQILVLYVNSTEEQEKMRALMEQYRDLPMDLADASLVATAEALNQRQIFTLDRDFHIYRFHGNQPFEVVP